MNSLEEKKEKSSKNKRKHEIAEVPISEIPHSPFPTKKKKDEEEDEKDVEEQDLDYKDLEFQEDEDIPDFKEFYRQWLKANGLEKLDNSSVQQASNVNQSLPLPVMPVPVLQAQIQLVELKGKLCYDSIHKFEQYLLACKNANIAATRKNLIHRDACIEISQMLDAHAICSDESWTEWNDQKLFEALYSAFPKSGDQRPFESVECRLTKTNMAFKLAQGASSLFPFTKTVKELLNTLEEDSVTDELSKSLLKILMSRFPEDETHQFL